MADLEPPINVFNRQKIIEYDALLRQKGQQ